MLLQDRQAALKLLPTSRGIIRLCPVGTNGHFGSVEEAGMDGEADDPDTGES